MFLGFTSVGKSYCIAKIIKLLNTKKPGATTCIVVPSIDLKKDFLETVERFELKDVDVFVINSFSQAVVNGVAKEYDLFVADELHTLCNDSSRYFSEVIPQLKFNYFFGVSATLESNHITYLKKHGLEVFFEVPLEDGYRTDIVPEYCIYNIPVQLEPKERLAYNKIQKEYLSLVAAFTPADNNPVTALRACLKKKDELVKFQGVLGTSKEHAVTIGEYLGKPPGVVINMARRWQSLVTLRRTELSNSVNGLRMVVKLIRHIKEPAVIVCGSIKVADFLEQHIPDSKAFHSSSKGNAKNKKDFTEGRLKFLLVVRGLKEGYNNDKLRFIIRQGYTGKALDLTQYLGRLLRPDKNNPNKFSVLINIYVEDYLDEKGKLMESQQKKWLKSSLYKRSFVEWVENVNQILI